MKPAPDQELYVEPAIMLSRGGEVVIAGRPTYLWQRIGGRDSLVSRNEVFGVVVRDGVAVTVIPNPLGSVPVRPLTAGATGRDSWGFVFAEIDPGPDIRRWTMSNDGALERLLYGELSGNVWSPLQELPLGSITKFVHTNGSNLIAHADTLVWVVPAELPDGRAYSALFERIDGKWTERPFDPRYRTRQSYFAAVHLENRGFLIAAVQPDTTHSGEGNALFMYRRGDEWQIEGKLIAGGDNAVHFPSWIVSGPVQSILTWISPSPGRGNSAMAIWGTPRIGSFAAVVVDSAVLHDSPAIADWPDGPYWVSHHLEAGGSARLRLLRARDGRVETRWSSEYPYTGDFGATSVDQNALLISGPLLDTLTPKLTSLMIALQRHCST